MPPPHNNKMVKWLVLIAKNITVEPVMFLYMLAFMLTSVVEQKFFVDRACRVDLGYSDEVCSNIESDQYADQKVQVQKYVATFSQYYNIAAHGVPLILALFLGAWSDKKGGARKAPLVAGLIGKVFYSLMFTVNAWQSSWGLYTTLYTATLPSALTGADLAIFMAAFSYVADVSTPQDRTARVTIVQASYLVTIPTGVALGKLLYNASGNSIVVCFLVNTLLVTLALVYAVFRLRWRTAPESVSEEKKKNFLLEFFDRKLLAATLRALVRKRPGPRRAFLWGLLIAMCFYTFQRDESSMMYLYTQLVFDFGLNQYSNFRTYQSSVYVIGMLISVPVLSKLCQMPDSVAALIGAAAHSAARIVFIFADQTYLLYVGATLSGLGPVVAPVIKSMVSKVVPLSDRGKVMAVLASTDNAVPLLSGVVYTQVYNATITTFPQAFFLVTIASQIIVMSILGAIQYRLKGAKLDDGESDTADEQMKQESASIKSASSQNSDDLKI